MIEDRYRSRDCVGCDDDCEKWYIRHGLTEARAQLSTSHIVHGRSRSRNSPLGPAHTKRIPTPVRSGYPARPRHVPAARETAPQRSASGVAPLSSSLSILACYLRCLTACRSIHDRDALRYGSMVLALGTRVAADRGCLRRVRVVRPSLSLLEPGHLFRLRSQHPLTYARRHRTPRGGICQASAACTDKAVVHE